jgi:hypothetical protein
MVRVCMTTFCVLAAALPACTYRPPPDVAAENERLRSELADRTREKAELSVSLEETRRQLREARGISDDQLARVAYPESLLFDTLTGGDDYDGKPGDDGVTVYLKPLDREGDVIKASGDLRIELYDLESPEGSKLLGTYEFPVDALRKLWYGKFMTYHYTLRCPWRAGPPAHPEITVRAIFTDYLTKRVVTAQTVCRFRAAAPSDAGAP